MVKIGLMINFIASNYVYMAESESTGSKPITIYEVNSVDGSLPYL